jgi:hypothetical protein
MITEWKGPLRTEVTRAASTSVSRVRRLSYSCRGGMKNSANGIWGSLTRSTTAPSDTNETLCTEFRRVHCAVLSTDSWAAGQSKHYDIANAAAHIYGMIDAPRC